MKRPGRYDTGRREKNEAGEARMEEKDLGKKAREGVAMGLMLFACAMLRLVLLPACLVYRAADGLRVLLGGRSAL